MILATDEDAKVKDAVALRFKELCEERNLSPNALAVRSGVTPSTVYSMLDSSQQLFALCPPSTIENERTKT